MSKFKRGDHILFLTDDKLPFHVHDTPPKHVIEKLRKDGAYVRLLPGDQAYEELDLSEKDQGMIIELAGEHVSFWAWQDQYRPAIMSNQSALSKLKK